MVLLFSTLQIALHTGAPSNFVIWMIAFHLCWSTVIWMIIFLFWKMLLADLLLCYSRPCSFSGILADLLFPPCYESKLTNTSCYPIVVCSWEPHCCFLHACYWFMLSFNCLHGNCWCFLLVLYDHSRFFTIKLLLFMVVIAFKFVQWFLLAIAFKLPSWQLLCLQSGYRLWVVHVATVTYCYWFMAIYVSQMLLWAVHACHGYILLLITPAIAHSFNIWTLAYYLISYSLLFVSYCLHIYGYVFTYPIVYYPSFHISYATVFTYMAIVSSAVFTYVILLSCICCYATLHMPLWNAYCVIDTELMRISKSPVKAIHDQCS